MAAKILTSRYPNTRCCVCHELIAQGSQMEQQKTNGKSVYRHLACRGQAATPKPAPTERSVRFAKPRMVDGNQVFDLRVEDPVDASGLEGTMVKVALRKGGTMDVKLGKCREVVSQHEAIYEKGAAAPLPGPDVVPAGRYCVPILDPKPGGNDFLFINIWRHKDDPKRVGAYMVLGPHESTRLNTKRAIERIIEVGVAEAAKAYGDKVKRCSQCGARLTNRLSRELGIGPVCGNRVNDDDTWYSMKKQAKDTLLKAGLDPQESVDDGLEFDWTQIVEPEDADALLDPASDEPKPKGKSKVNPDQLSMPAVDEADMLDPAMLKTVKSLWSNADDGLRAALRKSDMNPYIEALSARGEI